MVDLSIVIPAYNEAKRIGDTLDKIEAYCRAQNRECEIIVVDDGSRDGTARLLKKRRKLLPGSRVLTHPYRRGKGAAVKTGMMQTLGGIILVTDADLSAPIEEFEKLKKELSAGYDIVIGSRALTGSRIERHQMRLREWMGKMFNVLIRVFLMGDFRDTQCGFKLFRGDAGRRIFARVRTKGFAFDVEVLYLAKRQGLRIKEVPVTWAHRENSRVNIVLSPALMLCDLLFIKVRGWLGGYR